MLLIRHEDQNGAESGPDFETAKPHNKPLLLSVLGLISNI